jgi:hypothetical protein
MTPLAEATFLTVFLIVCFTGVGLALAYAITGLRWQMVSALATIGVSVVVCLVAIGVLLTEMWGSALA